MLCLFCFHLFLNDTSWTSVACFVLQTGSTAFTTPGRADLCCDCCLFRCRVNNIDRERETHFRSSSRLTKMAKCVRFVPKNANLLAHQTVGAPVVPSRFYKCAATWNPSKDPKWNALLRWLRWHAVCVRKCSIMEERQITDFWVQSVAQMFELQRPKLSLNKYSPERKQSIVNSSLVKSN